MSLDRTTLDCDALDELAPAYALGAVDAGEERAAADHLAGCDRPHAEARELIGVAALVPAALDPVVPSAGLRDRLMATVARTPQEHRQPVAPLAAPVLREPSRRRWHFSVLPSAVAAGALAIAVGAGAWGLSLNAQVAERDAAIRAIAGAHSIYAAQGSAGSGWVIESDGQAMFMTDDLEALPNDLLYEFWLIDAAGNAVAAGILTETDGVALVILERGLEGATTFAVTVETERVEQSVNDPVMVAALDS